MCLHWNLVLYLLNLPLLSILLNLLSESIFVCNIILLFQQLIMLGDDVLLFLLPSELFSFEIANIFDFFAFLFETLVCLLIDFLEVLNVLLALSLCMIINLKWSLGSQEVRICIMVICTRDLFSTEC